MTLVIETRPIPLTSNKQGTIIVSGTRIPLDTIVNAFRNGDSAEEIVESFDVLKLADVYAIISYYLDHQKEVDSYLQEREKEATILRAEIEKRYPSHGLRQRLMVRKRNGNP